MRVSIIGSGNVAEALALALHECGAEVVEIVARNREEGCRLASMVGAAHCDPSGEPAEADLFLIAVSDRAVEEVAATVRFSEGAMVAHTAGCVRLDAIPSHLCRAVIYPFQTFTKGRRVNFREIPLFIEADDETTLTRAKGYAQMLSDNIFEADSERRKWLHLAGVFASNFTNHMLACATEVLGRADLPFSVLAPVIAETASKAIDSGDPKSVQTGPAARGDVATRERHIALIADNEQLKEIYNKISDNIWLTKTSKR